MLTSPPARASTGALVLDLIRTHPSISRVELADRTGLTAATITHVVRELMTDGLVHETGRVRSKGGSPRRLLELESEVLYAVGVQMERCTTTIVITDFTGRQIAMTGLRGVGQGTPQETLRTLAEHIEALLAHARIPRDRVLGVGLVTHGPQDRARGMILTPQPTAPWREFPLTTTLSDLLHLPVLLENDATAAAIGEQWAGSLDVDTFGVIYMASGVGGGVITDSEVYRGRASNTVEIGHLPIDPAGPECICGSRGCVEAVAGPVSVVQRAMSSDLGDRLELRGIEDETLADFERIARAANRGDDAARALLDESARHLGTAAVALLNLFDLDTVVLAGPAFATAGPLYAARIDQALQRGALARLLRPVGARLSSNVRAAAAVGGALIVLRSPLVRAQPGTASPAVAPAPATTARPVAYRAVALG
ncbi:ROK family transcriptional regulator [Pengzhenrongella frigida]|nr:ROK family transcriptional regulator [Cellulomonas sp. HLT2-17]